MQKLLNSYWGLCLRSTDGRDDHGRTSRHHPADVISKGIHLMSLAFGHASGAWLVLIESLLMDHSLVPTPFFWVQTFWLGSWFSFELSDWSAREGLAFGSGLLGFFGPLGRLPVNGWTPPFFGGLGNRLSLFYVFFFGHLVAWVHPILVPLGIGGNPPVVPLHGGIRSDHR